PAPPRRNGSACRGRSRHRYLLLPGLGAARRTALGAHAGSLRSNSSMAAGGVRRRSRVDLFRRWAPPRRPPTGLRPQRNRRLCNRPPCSATRLAAELRNLVLLVCRCARVSLFIYGYITVAG